MAFQKQVLPECPRCKRNGLRVIESRKTADSTRRRKACECCEFRLTTHEVTAEFYNEAQQNKLLISKLHALLGSGHFEPGATTIKCNNCSHNQGGECAFNFPEYDTIESFDCNHYEH